MSIDIDHAGIGTADTSRSGSWIRTYTGRRFWPLDPRPEEVDIRDIAHSLALQCRFTGHCSEFYSIAEHSVVVSGLVEAAGCVFIHDLLRALLHDASEAYLCDIPRPLKCDPSFAHYRRMEWSVQTAVLIRYGLSQARLPVETFWTPEAIKHADNVALRTEARDLMGDPQDWIWPDDVTPWPAPIQPWDWRTAERRFLERFEELTGERIGGCK